MLRLERPMDEAAMTAQLCRYFEGLGLTDTDPDEVAAEYLHAPEVHVFRILDDTPQGFHLTEDYPDFTDLRGRFRRSSSRRRGRGSSCSTAADLFGSQRR